jgi:hypothetical protein
MPPAVTDHDVVLADETANPDEHQRALLWRHLMEVLQAYGDSRAQARQNPGMRGRESASEVRCAQSAANAHIKVLERATPSSAVISWCTNSPR